MREYLLTMQNEVVANCLVMSSSYFSHALHHCNELLVINLSVVIGIYAIEELIYLLFTQSEIVTLKTYAKFVSADSSAAILVEVGEGSLQLVLLQVVVALEASRDEFTVVDQTILI